MALTPEEVLGILSVRCADGTEFCPQGLPLCRRAQCGRDSAGGVDRHQRARRPQRHRPLQHSPIRSEQGGIESFVVAIQGLTLLEDMERLRAEFLGMVSH